MYEHITLKDYVQNNQYEIIAFYYINLSYSIM